jgi:hypothetical protein
MVLPLMLPPRGIELNSNIVIILVAESILMLKEDYIFI